MWSKNHALALGLIALGTSEGQAKELKLKFDRRVPEEQSQILGNDLRRLDKMSLSASSEMLRIYGLKDGEGASLSSWLSERVQWVLSEDFNLEKSLRPSPATLFFRFPNPGIIPDIETPTKTAEPGGEVKTVMSNLGGALYLGGKQAGLLINVAIEGKVGGLDIRSPRTGLLKVGEGLFFKGGKLAKASPDFLSHYRLSTLVHEARHSDGNGKSLGFLHATCPEGHDLAGYPACDRNLNGPYMVGALFSQAMAKDCDDCSEVDKELYQLVTADSFNRVIREYPDPNADVDPGEAAETRVGNLKLIVDTCDTLVSLGRPDSENCTQSRKELVEVLAHPDSLEPEKKLIKTTEWDATPEGKR